ncbi:MAG: hypothetical protein RL120_10710 [Gammaproteobacteria bacterium]
MSDTTVRAVPRSFYWIGGIGLVWNLIGVVTYVMQVSISPESLATMPPEQQALYTDIPVWATSAYATAVNAGWIGCLLLLLRRKLALPLLVLSLLAVIVQFGHAYLMTDALAVLGPASLVLPLLICVIGVFLIWYAWDSANKNWLH